MGKLSCFFGFHNDELLEAVAFIDHSYDKKVPSAFVSYRCAICNRVSRCDSEHYYGRFMTLAGAQKYIEEVKKSFGK